MSDFILPSIVWDEAKLRATFLQDDVVQILKIPLSIRRLLDKWGSIGSKNNKFSAKSAYVLDQNKI